MVDQANKFKSEDKQGVNDYSFIIYRKIQLLIKKQLKRSSCKNSEVEGIKPLGSEIKSS